MSLEEKFRIAAQGIVKKFAEDIGKSTFKSFVSSSYDAELGKVTNTYLDPVEVYIAYVSVLQKWTKISKTAAEEPSYISDGRVAIIAGLDLTVAPKENDVIIAADNGLTYYIYSLETDLYKAKYSCTIKLIPGE